MTCLIHCRLAGVLVVLSALADVAAAQPILRVQFVPNPSPRRPSDPTAVGTTVMAEKRLQQRLQRAREFLDQGQFVDALPVLQQALDEPADAFVPDPKDATKSVSLKSFLERQLVELSDEGRRSYELQFGPVARQFLASEQNDPADAFRRYPIVDSGADAAWRVGLSLLDRGRFAEAERILQPLRTTSFLRSRFEPDLTVRLAAIAHRRGDAPRAAALLEELVASHPAVKVRIADRSFDNSAESREWLAKFWGLSSKELRPFAGGGWMGFGAGPERRSLVAMQARAEPPKWPGEGVSVVLDPLKAPSDGSDSGIDRLLRETIDALTALKDRDRRLWWPRFQPVILGDLAVYRTVGNVRAVRLTNGARAWETLADEHMERLLARNDEAPESSPSFRNYVDQRMWDDATASRLSSDGRLVFAIEDSGPARPVDNAQARRQTPPTEWNRLAAYDASTGKLVWELGGPAGDFSLPEPDCFFLGAPLPVDDRLYVFSEKSGTQRLHEISAADGRVLWTQPLVDADSSWTVARNSTRRLAGMTPTISDGILVCVTGVGLVVGVDLVRRRLAWVQDLPQPTTEGGMAHGTPQPVEASKDTGWVDGTPVIVGDDVLIPRAGGHPLYSLSLRDGSRRWSMYSRALPSNARWLAIDSNGRMIVVGERAVRAYRLDGKEPVMVWRKETAIPTPCGTGFVVDGVLHLPTREINVAETTGSLLSLDVTTGEILKSTPVLKGRAPGNLALSYGLVISQSSERLDVFPLPEVSRQK